MNADISSRGIASLCNTAHQYRTPCPVQYLSTFLSLVPYNTACAVLVDLHHHDVMTVEGPTARKVSSYSLHEHIEMAHVVYHDLYGCTKSTGAAKAAKLMLRAREKTAPTAVHLQPVSATSSTRPLYRIITQRMALRSIFSVACTCCFLHLTLHNYRERACKCDLRSFFMSGREALVFHERI